MYGVRLMNVDASVMNIDYTKHHRFLQLLEKLSYVLVEPSFDAHLRTLELYVHVTSKFLYDH